ncbi:hypothetical protein F7732_00390 [Bacillus mesophilum]|uniref:Transcription initiation factor TFIIIB n=1 Tax=Bacillus mesophilum TaxID=1071718 RepID=A0A7V7RPG3_9BACI|nr:hypothetical protein [Bacillus mesophilum]KAB2333985.1 hypothetical protein F7732_07845 [Bacillus mesophilum]KAB2335068.1 hypothetical protein F7732_00390 [Bacillus mesophilum]
MTTKQICKICGNDKFVQGQLGNGHTSLVPIDKILGSSLLIFTFCKKCGEVASIKVKNPSKF